MVTKFDSTEELIKNAVNEFRLTFNCEPKILCAAPGRVNLIGEHVDYNNGFVLPVALEMVTIMVGCQSDGYEADILTLCKDADQNKRIKFDTRNVLPGTPKWANYVKGVVHNYGVTVPGFKAVITTNVPIGGGLSSSAAIEVATLQFLEILIGIKHNELDKALICQKAEHDFAGMPCGIMDQLISVMGRKKHALLIDCESLDVKHIPFNTDDITILICNSNVRHELSASEYPTRRAQCIKALKLMNLTNYRDCKIEDLNKLMNDDNNVYLRRARHVITEIQRTSEASEALIKNDFIQMGKLMTESHLSLRDDFEVSCNELDILVETANECIGVLGSRMTGGGFGGCTVTLVHNNEIDNVVKYMKKVYMLKANCNADFYICKPSDGVRSINIKEFL